MMQRRSMSIDRAAFPGVEANSTATSPVLPRSAGWAILMKPGHAVDLTAAEEELGMLRTSKQERPGESLKLEGARTEHDEPSSEDLAKQWMAISGPAAPSLDLQASRLLDAAADRRSLLEEVAKMASDPALQHILLMAALQMAKRRGVGGLWVADRIADALDELDEE